MNMDSSLYINTNNVDNAAQELKNLIQEIGTDMDDLYETFNGLIPAEIQFDWAETLRDDWEAYKNNDIENALHELSESVGNLGLVEQNVEEYATEE